MSSIMSMPYVVGDFSNRPQCDYLYLCDEISQLRCHEARRSEACLYGQNGCDVVNAELYEISYSWLVADMGLPNAKRSRVIALRAP